MSLKKYSYPAFFIILQAALVQFPLFTDLLMGAALTASLFLGCFFCALLVIFWPNITPRLVFSIPLVMVPVVLISIIVTIQIFQAMGIADPGMREGILPHISMPVMEAYWKSLLISALITPIIAMGLVIRKKADRMLARVGANDREERGILHELIRAREKMPELSVYKFEWVQQFAFTFVLSYHLDRLGFVQAIRVGDDLVIFNLAMSKSKRQWSLAYHLMSRLLARPEINDPTLQKYYMILPDESPVPHELLKDLGFQTRDGEEGQARLKLLKDGLDKLFHEEFPEWDFSKPYSKLFEIDKPSAVVAPMRTSMLS